MILEGKTAIVTGGAMGIGRTMAEALAGEGAQIVIADREGAGQAASSMITAGYTAIGLDCDVSSEADTERMVQETVARFGAIDILVNNAGVYSSLEPGPFEEQTVEQWRKVLDVNVIGVFLCCKAAVKPRTVIDQNASSEYPKTPRPNTNHRS